MRNTGQTGETRRRRRRAAFTLLEVLIVIAVILIMLSILIVGLNVASRTSQSAHTQSLMRSLGQGLVRFKEDVGYFPPVLDINRRLDEGPDPGSGAYVTDVQTWYSWTTLGEYLIGYDERTRDGYGGADPTINEVPLTGIRNPGADGVWGAGPAGSLNQRDPVVTGRVLGPYLELEDTRLLGSTTGEIDPDGRLIVYFPGEDDFDPAGTKVLVDYWGTPISYLRRSYPRGALNQSYRAVDYDGDGVPDPVRTLSDIYYLRPFQLLPGTEADAPGAPDATGFDTTTTFALQSAEFALFSPGPDRAFNATLRVDPDEFNKDNIVEVGP